MASSTSLRISITLRCSTSHNEPFPWSTLTNSFATRQPPSRAATLTCSSSRRRRRNSDTTPVTSKITKKKNLPRKNVEESDVNVDEDAFEALFRQLEEDLKNDELNSNDDEDDEISEEELVKLERELAEALGDDELIAAFESIAGGETDIESEDEDHDIDNGGDQILDEDEEEEMPLKLKNWQIRRLAHALKYGRRKTTIKDLAAELCLDRAEVLKLLRDPPPSLVLMSAALPDKPISVISNPVEEEPIETVDTLQHAANPEIEKKESVHVMHNNWSARKRLKKAQVETLEQVYTRTKRPTNAMISSVVHVTNLPRKRVVKWFEDKRAEEGVPENRVPYQNPDAIETAFTC